MTISSDLKVKRKTLIYFEPTDAWLRSRNPVGKSEILKWYETESRILDLRRTRSVERKFTYFEQTVDAETRKPIGKKRGPYETTIEKWKLSEQDYRVYKRGLEEGFARRKREHNERVRAAKANESNDGGRAKK